MLAKHRKTRLPLTDTANEQGLPVMEIPFGSMKSIRTDQSKHRISHKLVCLQERLNNIIFVVFSHRQWYKNDKFNDLYKKNWSLVSNWVSAKFKNGVSKGKRISCKQYVSSKTHYTANKEIQYVENVEKLMDLTWLPIHLQNCGSKLHDAHVVSNIFVKYL